jgi:hypothetical protein
MTLDEAIEKLRARPPCYNLSGLLNTVDDVIAAYDAERAEGAARHGCCHTWRWSTEEILGRDGCPRHGNPKATP